MSTSLHQLGDVLDNASLTLGGLILAVLLLASILYVFQPAVYSNFLEWIAKMTQRLLDTLHAVRCALTPSDAVRDGVVTVVTLAVTVVALPFLAPMAVVMRCYNGAVEAVLHRANKDSQIMLDQDAIWQQDNAVNPAVISGIMCMSGRGDVAAWRHAFLTRMVTSQRPDGSLKFPKFSAIATQKCHRWMWTHDKDFDINRHVIFHEDVVSDVAELQDLVGRLVSRPLPEDRPKWKMTLIAYAEKYLVLVQIHHSIGDGISLQRMLLQTLSEVDHGVKSEPSKNCENNNGKISKICENGNKDEPMSKICGSGDKDVAIKSSKKLSGESCTKKRFGTQVQENSMKVLQAVIGMPAAAFTSLVRPFERNALHGPTLSGEKLVAWSEPISLELVKRMKTEAGCTVNDVLLSSLACSFRSYFRRHCSEVPNNIMTSIPVDIRNAPANSELRLDNQFALIFLSLPLGERDARDTLQATVRRIAVIKRSAEPLINSWLLRLVMARLPSWLSKLVFDVITDKSSCVVSNVPGPAQAVVMCGDVMENAIFWVPQRSYIGMGISILSYNGSVILGLMVDKALMSNPTSFVSLYRDQVFDLARQLGLDDVPTA